MPAVPAAGVPASTPVAAVKLTPEGNAPDSDSVGAGRPVAVTVKEPREPRTKVALLALVMAGAWFTVSVKLCVASAPTPLLAVIVIGNVPAVPAAGVPASVPALNSTPLGKAPLSLNEGAGAPVAVTVKDAATPTIIVVLFALVIAGA